MAEDKETFLARWSRLKREAHGDEVPEKPVTPQEAANEAPLELPPLEKLDFESDYTAFFHPRVDEGTRRAALKRLFGDARFNVMDGLDVYIDDYSKPNPLPAEMLASLRQAQRILDWARQDRDRLASTESTGSETKAPAALDEPHAGPRVDIPESQGEPVPLERPDRGPA